MKKLFLSMMLLALPILVSAYDIQIDGIYYNLNSVEKTAEVTLRDYYSYPKSDYSGAVTIPGEVTLGDVDYTVTSIGKSAFQECKGLTSVTIPNSVNSIGSHAFDGCGDLISVTIPNTVKSIGSHAFDYCINLTSISIPQSLTYIEECTFRGCFCLTSVTIPNSVNTIGPSAFYECSSLSSLTIPESVTSIGDMAFFCCSGLTSVTIPNSVISIGTNAFSGCSGFPIEYGIRYVDTYLMEVVDKTQSTYTIREGTRFIAENAFSKCYSLTSITIPNSVISIGYSAFWECTSLTTVDIPNSITVIPRCLFKGCTSLTSVTIPNSVTTIEGPQNYYGAFQGCSNLVSITIPSSVTSIGYKVFADCHKLEKVYCLASKVPSTNSNAFENSGIQYATLYVLADMVKAFKSVAPWSDFGTIKSLEESGIDPNPDPGNPKCATPSISYADKELSFSCATDGVEYHYTITDSDIKSDVASRLSLSATYEISVYASKNGYNNSDIATATLVWTDAIFTETTPETPTSAKAVQESIPVLISSNGGEITVKSEQEGQPVAVYTADGKAIGSITMKDGQASITTNLQRGEIAVVKVGSKSVKIKM